MFAIIDPVPIPFSLTDIAFLGLTLLLLSASWGLIVLCDRLMEDSK